MIRTNFRLVAADCFEAVVQEFEDVLERNGVFDGDASQVEEMPNLYVYSGGDWVIEYSDYLQSHRYVAMAPLANYKDAEALEDALVNGYNENEEQEED